jgi:pilus assembly protein CpaE
VSRVLQIVVVGADPALRDEIDEAYASLTGAHPVVHEAPDFRHGLAMARSRQPQVVCVDLAGPVAPVAEFVREIRLAAPAAAVVVVYQPSQLDLDRSGDASSLIALMRAGVQDFLRRPVSSTEVRGLLDRLIAEPVGVQPPAGRVVSFVSNKGGVGKTTLAVNVACALAERHPDQVLLIDASLQLGLCADLLDLPHTPSITDAIRERERLDETLLRRLSLPHACGLRLLGAPVDAIEAAAIDDEALSRVITLARRTFEFVVVDTFPLMDSLVMAVLDMSDRAYVVFQGTAPCVAGIARFLPVLEGVNLPPARQRLVLSQNYRRFSGNLSPADIEQHLGRSIDFTVPYDKRLYPAMNSGQPLILRASRRFGFGRVIATMTDDVATLREAVDQPWPSSEGAA